MFPRLAAALLLCLGLVACKENDGQPVGAQFVQGVGNIRVIDTHIVPSSDNSAQISGGTINYLMVRLELTNDFGTDAVPQIDHFYLIDQNGNRFQAKDSGASVFTGISNSQQVLAKDAKREYTMGFRTNSLNPTGTISYDR